MNQVSRRTSASILIKPNNIDEQSSTLEYELDESSDCINEDVESIITIIQEIIMPASPKRRRLCPFVLATSSMLAETKHRSNESKAALHYRLQTIASVQDVSEDETTDLSIDDCNNNLEREALSYNSVEVICSVGECEHVDKEIIQIIATYVQKQAPQPSPRQLSYLVNIICSKAAFWYNSWQRENTRAPAHLRYLLQTLAILIRRKEVEVSLPLIRSMYQLLKQAMSAAKDEALGKRTINELVCYLCTIIIGKDTKAQTSYLLSENSSKQMNFWSVFETYGLSTAENKRSEMGEETSAALLLTLLNFTSLHLSEILVQCPKKKVEKSTSLLSALVQMIASAEKKVYPAVLAKLPAVLRSALLYHTEPAAREAVLDLLVKAVRMNPDADFSNVILAMSECIQDYGVDFGCKAGYVLCELLTYSRQPIFITKYLEEVRRLLLGSEHKDEYIVKLSTAIMFLSCHDKSIMQPTIQELVISKLFTESHFNDQDYQSLCKVFQRAVATKQSIHIDSFTQSWKAYCNKHHL